MGAYNDYRANRASVRGRLILPGSDQFLSVAVPASYQLDGTVGASVQVISKTSDRSAVVTITCGAFTLAHATLSAAFNEQEATVQSGGSPMGAMAFQLSNGDVFSGPGVLSNPTTVDGGTQSGQRAWTVMIPEAAVQYGVGLDAVLAATGAV